MITTELTIIDRGDMARCWAEFTDAAGAYVDPSYIQFNLMDPSGVVTMREYPIDPTVVRASQGRFYSDVDADEEGTWNVRYHSTGTVQAAAEAQYIVQLSRFL